MTDLNNSALNEISVNPQNENELTSESFWTGVWGAHPPRRRRRSWLRQRLKQLAARHSDRMFAKFVEITGTPAGDLLEIGCAPGATLEEIHRACPQLHLHGIDYSESGLEMARRRLKELQIEATLHCGDAFHAQLPQRYDIVLSTGVIEHFVDPVPIIQCHARLAKPLGHVVVTVPNCASPIPHYFLKVFDPELLAAHNLETMNVARLRELLLQAGLDDAAHWTVWSAMFARSRGQGISVRKGVRLSGTSLESCCFFASGSAGLACVLLGCRTCPD